MGRYEIATGKKKSKPIIEPVRTFGFESELTNGMKRTFPSRRGQYFELQSQQVARIGIVYDKEMLFTGTNTHFCKSYFLCKSTEGYKAPCCDYSKKVFRTACVLIIYKEGVGENITSENFTYELKPWVFGVKTYGTLKDYHARFPLQENDIILHRNHHVLKIYDIQSHGPSLWQKAPIKKSILDQARPIQEQMKNFIGSDLSVPEIEELIKLEDFPNHAGSVQRDNPYNLPDRLRRR